LEFFVSGIEWVEFGAVDWRLVFRLELLAVQQLLELVLEDVHEVVGVGLQPLEHAGLLQLRHVLVVHYLLFQAGRGLLHEELLVELFELGHHLHKHVRIHLYALQRVLVHRTQFHLQIEQFGLLRLVLLQVGFQIGDFTLQLVSLEILLKQNDFPDEMDVLSDQRLFILFPFVESIKFFDFIQLTHFSLENNGFVVFLAADGAEIGILEHFVEDGLEVHILAIVRDFDNFVVACFVRQDGFVVVTLLSTSLLADLGCDQFIGVHVGVPSSIIVVLV